MIGHLFAPGSPTQVLLDAMPAMVFIVDEHVRVLDANLPAAKVLGADAGFVLRRLCGDVLRCLNAGVAPAPQGEPGPCGTSHQCADCGLRQSTLHALAGQPPAARRHVMRLLVGPDERETHFLVTATRFRHDGGHLVMLILEDVTELVELRRIVPVCAWCKKVRDDGAYRDSLERYLRKHAIVEVTHSICPECQKREFAEANKLAPPDTPK